MIKKKQVELQMISLLRKLKEGWVDGWVGGWFSDYSDRFRNLINIQNIYPMLVLFTGFIDWQSFIHLIIFLEIQGKITF